jgi:endonuclease V-like protein UPF0215 family
MKEFPITIGIDDAKFKLKADSKTAYLIGVVCQGTRVVSVLKSNIDIDGDNATDAVIRLVQQNQKHLQYILTDTITFGGFNIIDLQEIFKNTNKPIIAITERPVNLDSVKKALLKQFPSNYTSKLEKIISAGNLYETRIATAGGSSTIYFHTIGITTSEVEHLLQKLCIDSKLPEPLRLAHVIGKMF